MKKIIGITDGVPLHHATWSGSSRRFFLECEHQNILEKAFGVDASIIEKYYYLISNYSRCKARWRRQYYMDVGYRQSLTNQILKKIKQENFNCNFLQIGAMFNVPEVVRGRARCYSYNDGNFIMALKSPYFPDNISKYKINAAIKYERNVNEEMDHIFTMSEYLKNSFIKDYGIQSSKVSCIGAGVNIDALPLLEGNKDYSKKQILFIGVDFSRKGGPDLLKAFNVVKERMPDAILNIVGPNEINNFSLASGVVMHGFLRKNVHNEAQKLASLFKNATLFVMPSVYEPFGIAPLEAMSYQIPCVVSDAWALPEIVPHNKCGKLVPPGNWEELAECIISLLSNPSLLKEYGEAGRKHVEDNFTWDKVVRRLKIIVDV